MSELPKQSEIDWSKMTIATDKTYEIYNPTYVGYYQIGGHLGLRISLQKKPCWLHRKMMKLCLGWEWGDGSPF